MNLKLPWLRPSCKPSGDLIVQASALSLERRRHIPSFLVAAIRLGFTARRTNGFAGLSLIADLKSRTFYTLSAWSDEAALRQFVSQSSHQSVMRQFGPKMADSHFVTWSSADSTDPNQYPPKWDSALIRLSQLRKEQ